MVLHNQVSLPDCTPPVYVNASDNSSFLNFRRRRRTRQLRRRRSRPSPEKVNNMVLFDQGNYDKFLTEAPKYKLITPSILSDRLRINGSLAWRTIRELMARGLIRMVSAHASQ
ncbi:40S ribosomal protein S25-2 [Pyrus ussuriensis x Pyrus communis]|uniref:40S ribosomal protein S25 n=1 Tax=Pyrus ussuriensis x Pyrus communis TaxID=2448454 RepID=A0A5N5I7A6_9ROSA|nr:40S ribosomal protein S25-2 [Pyrus ussuriensis x Pyrus communis]